MSATTRTDRLTARRSAYEPRRFFALRDRVTDVFEIHPDEWRRYVGTVITSDTLTLTVRWDGDAGVGRYAHEHEPDTLRHATPDDERAATDRGARLAVAAELRRLALLHPHWPEPVRRTLTGRARELADRIEG